MRMGCPVITAQIIHDFQLGLLHPIYTRDAVFRRRLNKVLVAHLLLVHDDS